MLFRQFSNIIIYVKIVRKIPHQHLNVWSFSNQEDMVQKKWRTTGQICPILSTRILTLSPGLQNNHTFKCWSGIFPTVLTYMIMLENCQNNISVYDCSQIQGTTFYSCWNFMKPGSQSATYTGFKKKMFIVILQEQEELIRRLTLYVVPVAFAIILFIGLIGNTLVILVVGKTFFAYCLWLTFLLDSFEPIF